MNIAIRPSVAAATVAAAAYGHTLASALAHPENSALPYCDTSIVGGVTVPYIAAYATLTATTVTNAPVRLPCVASTFRIPSPPLTSRGCRLHGGSAPPRTSPSCRPCPSSFELASLVVAAEQRPLVVINQVAFMVGGTTVERTSPSTTRPSRACRG